MSGVHKIRKGDSPWKIAARNLKEKGVKADNNAIVKEMQRLAQLNGCKNVDDLSTKFFNRIGLELKTDNNFQIKAQGQTQGTTGKRRTPTNINTVNRVAQTIANQGHRSSVIDRNQLTQSQKKQIESYQNLYKVEAKFVRDDNTKEVYAVFDLTNSPQAKKMGLKSLNIKLGNSDNIVNRYYANGKIVQDKIVLVDNEDGKKNKSILIQAPPKTPHRTKRIGTPLKIDIKVNPELYRGAAESQKAEFNQFVSELENQKANLMQDLGIDNDTYNRYVRLAIGIAVQESGLENGLSTGRKFKNSFAGQMASDTLRVLNIGANKTVGTDFSTATSKGLTKIKIGDWDDNPRIKKLFEKYGITRGYYNTLTPEQSAAATIIVLNELKNKVQNTKSYQDGIEAANNKFYYTNLVLKNGKPVKYPQGYWRYNKVTEDDAILYLYNGRSGTLKNGNATPAENIYTHNVRRYTQLVQVSEDKNARAQAISHAQITTTGNSAIKKMRDDLGWGLGQVTFRPDLYTAGANRNTKEEIAQLKNALVTKGYDLNSINRLISKLSKGELSFAKGLTKAEMDSITQGDVDLLLKHSDELNAKLKSVSSREQQRRFATSADKSFKNVYLASHAQQTSLSSVRNAAVTLTNEGAKDIRPYPSSGYYTGAQRRCNQLLPQLRGKHKPDGGLYLYNDRVKSGKYTGFCVEADKGINYANASQIDLLLAQSGADTANTLRTSGACLTGAKQSLIGSGAVNQDEMKSFNNAFQLAKFLEKHPERFIEVTHVKLDENTAREITAGDLSNLPAGCIVVFGNRSRTDVPGHAAITSGNGQMYADEIDNSNWDNFVATNSEQNGKGEHGYVRVFRLNPDYFTLDESGKVLVKK